MKMDPTTTKTVHKVALLALIMFSVCAYAQPASVTNQAEITIADKGAVLSVNCDFKRVPKLNPDEFLSLVIFITRTNGPEVSQKILETDYDKSCFSGIYFENPPLSRAVFFDDIHDKKSLARIGYRLMHSPAPLDEAIREGTKWEFSVSGFLTLTSPSVRGDQKVDMDWFGREAAVSAVLVGFKKTQGEKIQGFVVQRFFTPVVSSKVSLKR